MNLTKQLAILGMMALTGCGAADGSAGDDVDMQRQDVILSAPFSLYPGQNLWSNNGLYRLAMQTDCNLVLYAPNAIWSSNTYNRGVNCSAAMQTDGNLVVYANNGTKALWEAHTWGNPGSYLELQDDRNLVIYNRNHKALWSTNTWIRPDAGCYYVQPSCVNPPPLCVIEVCGSSRTPLYCGGCTY